MIVLLSIAQRLRRLRRAMFELDPKLVTADLQLRWLERERQRRIEIYELRREIDRLEVRARHWVTTNAVAEA